MLACGEIRNGNFNLRKVLLSGGANNGYCQAMYFLGMYLTKVKISLVDLDRVRGKNFTNLECQQETESLGFVPGTAKLDHQGILLTMGRPHETGTLVPKNWKANLAWHHVLGQAWPRRGEYAIAMHYLGETHNGLFEKAEYKRRGRKAMAHLERSA